MNLIETYGDTKFFTDERSWKATTTGRDNAQHSLTLYDTGVIERVSSRSDMYSKSTYNDLFTLQATLRDMKNRNHEFYEDLEDYELNDVEMALKLHRLMHEVLK